MSQLCVFSVLRNGRRAMNTRYCEHVKFEILKMCFLYVFVLCSVSLWCCFVLFLMKFEFWKHAKLHYEIVKFWKTNLMTVAVFVIIILFEYCLCLFSFNSLGILNVYTLYVFIVMLNTWTLIFVKLYFGVQKQNNWNTYYFVLHCFDCWFRLRCFV